MVHIAHKILPVRVMIYKGSPINVKLKHCLKPPIYVFIVLSVSFDFDYFKLFLHSFLIFDLFLFRGWFFEH